ncbi:Pentatricopeptide repeat [Macleaya cordata]|uniref:Pentatricopeptide repeat n=1 Tax=Macleaya cordata TaxID=56857 RepID=A0A200QQ75_MACCD|nr:Pentatricopeptide repeat [Macleaya cordata]
MKTRWAINRFNSHLSSSAISTSIENKLQSSQTLLLRSGDFEFPFNHVDTSLLLSLCGKEGNSRLGSSIHASIIKNSEHFDPKYQSNSRNVLAVWNSLVSMYSKCGELNEAAKVFAKMPIKDTVSWNSLISGFVRTGEFGKGFELFKKMHDLGSFRFDQATLTTILSVCDKTDRLYICKMMHSLVFHNGYEMEISVGNALITSYLKCGCSNSGKRMFDEMFERNVITWTAVISGLAQSQFFQESLSLFFEMHCGLVDPNSLTYSSSLMACSGLRAEREGRQIHGLILKSGLESDLCIGSSLMDMYSKCGFMEDACRIFDSAEELDEISMTVILVGFAQNGLEEEALQTFVKMVKAGIDIDANMLSAVLGVFGTDTSLCLGKQIHSLVIKKNFSSNVFVSNGLINMYSKCGDLGESINVFNQISERNFVSWNSMIAAFARHGLGFEALKLFEEMTLEGIEPTDITFLSLLHACSHIGSIQMGMEFLESMSKLHGISPRMEHYACVVDMLGRAGYLNEAKNFIENLPVVPGVLVWQALLGACSIHGDSKIGSYAADHLILAAPESPTPYILMANIYSSEGNWKERAKVIKRMKVMGMKKETGLSWIEIEKEVHSFVVADRTHPQTEIIYDILGQLCRLMKDEDYVPDKRFSAYDLYQETEFD